MDFNIENFQTQDLKDGKYISPKLAKYKINGESRDWELLKINNSVAILIYNRDNDSFVCVKQFRPAVYFNHGKNYTIELCAGLLDKDCSIEQTAKEEILEECGYDVPLDSLKKIASFYTCVGHAGSKQHLFFCEVNNAQKVDEGGGVEGEEMIEVVEVSVNKAREFMLDSTTTTTPGLMFGFEWFFNRR